jgi:hypothetical protein
VQAPAYGHGRTGTEDINGVGRVGRGYIVKYYFFNDFFQVDQICTLNTLEGRKTYDDKYKFIC